MKTTKEYQEIQDVKFAAKFKGYCKLSRSRYFFLINKEITTLEFVLLFLFWDVLACWDRRKVEYGVIDIDFELLSSQLGWSQSKLRFLTQSLVDKGYLARIGPKKYILTGFELEQSITKKDFVYYRELKHVIDQSVTEQNHNNVK